MTSASASGASSLWKDIREGISLDVQLHGVRFIVVEFVLATLIAAAGVFLEIALSERTLVNLLGGAFLLSFGLNCLTVAWIAVGAGHSSPLPALSHAQRARHALRLSATASNLRNGSCSAVWKQRCGISHAQAAPRSWTSTAGRHSSPWRAPTHPRAAPAGRCSSWLTSSWLAGSSGRLALHHCPGPPQAHAPLPSAGLLAVVIPSSAMCPH